MARVRRHPNNKAVAIVETAIVLPILILMTFAMIEYGWMFLKAEEITNAARHGARIAAPPDATNADVVNAINILMTRAGMGETGYTILMQPGDITSLAPGATLTVEVTVPYDGIRLTGIPLPVPTNLRASMSMAKEGS